MTVFKRVLTIFDPPSREILLEKTFEDPACSVKIPLNILFTSEGSYLSFLLSPETVASRLRYCRILSIIAGSSYFTWNDGMEHIDFEQYGLAVKVLLFDDQVKVWIVESTLSHSTSFYQSTIP